MDRRWRMYPAAFTGPGFQAGVFVCWNPLGAIALSDGTRRVTTASVRADIRPVPGGCAGTAMGKFFLIIIAISIALVLGTAVLVTHF
jgi:hypothetical protein